VRPRDPTDRAETPDWYLVREQVDLDKEKDFFETQVTEYRSGGSLDWSRPRPAAESPPAEPPRPHRESHALRLLRTLL